MDFSKVFDSILEILKKFIPQFNRVIIFLFSSYFLLGPHYKNSIKIWFSKISNSSFLFNLKNILKSFGIEAVLPFSALLILMTIIFYFDITSIQIGRILPPYLVYNTTKILRRYFSRENMIKVWKINPELRSINDIDDYLSTEFEKNSTNPGFENAFYFQQGQSNSEDWMSFLKFLCLWILLLPVFFPQIQNPQDISDKVWIVLFVVFICWIYFMRKHVHDMKWFCVWKMYSVLDLHQVDKNKDTIWTEDDLPDFLKEKQWEQEDRWWKEGAISRQRAVKITIFTFDFFEIWKDMVLAFFPLLEQLPFFEIPDSWKVWRHIEILKPQKSRYSLPIPSQSVIDYIQSQFYSKTTQQVVDVPNDLKENYEFFLSKVRGSGIVKIAPDGRYTGLIDLRRGGSSYSFSNSCHDSDYFCEISLAVGAKWFLAEQAGFILDLGDIELPKTKSLTSAFIKQINVSEISKLKKIIEFDAPSDESDFHKTYQEQSLSPYADAIVNHTYLLRAFGYKYNYKDSKREFIVNDVIVLFRAVRQLEDGSFILLWRLLHGSNTNMDKFLTIEI